MTFNVNKFTWVVRGLALLRVVRYLRSQTGREVRLRRQVRLGAKSNRGEKLDWGENQTR